MRNFITYAGMDLKTRGFIYRFGGRSLVWSIRSCIAAANDTTNEADHFSEPNSNQKQWLQFHNRPLGAAVEKTSVILFPGQGAQFVGMGRKLLNIPKVKEMFHCANEMLRTDLLNTCLSGPQAKLDQTIHCQPATYVVSLAALCKLQEEDHEIVSNCVATAGFSVGEITSLVFAGALTFEQGLHVVRVRAQGMQKACQETSGAMASVFIYHHSQLKLAIQEAINHCTSRLNIDKPLCKVANYLYPDCKVIAGHREAVEFIEKHAALYGIRKVKRLPVSGAFHTPLMSTALGSLSSTLQRMQLQQPPKIPVISNVDVRPYTSPESIRRKLVLQMVHPVRWEQTLHALYDRPPDAPYPRTVELGPGKQLGAMLRMVNQKAYAQYQAVDV